MKRFYLRSIRILKGDLDKDNIPLSELADDINDYVKYLEHEKSILINEISILNKNIHGNALLKRLGFKSITNNNSNKE